MKNLVEHSVKIVWDGLAGYKAYKDVYDYMGVLNDCTGIEHFLVEELSKGNRFSNCAEAIIKKVFVMRDSPKANSLYDAEIFHPLTGKMTMEIRCVQLRTSTSYSSEIGGGGRTPTSITDKKGLKTHWDAHLRTMHKLNNTAFFGFCDIRFTPELYISIIKSETILDLWNEGIYGIWRVIDGEDKFLLPQFMTREQFYKYFYGVKNTHQVKWKNENPWNISPEKAAENIKIFNNQLGYEETRKRIGIEQQQRINIDDEIKKKLGIYSAPSKATRTSKRGTEIDEMIWTWEDENGTD